MIDKYILKEDYDKEKLYSHQENIRNFQKEIRQTEKKGIENEFKNYLDKNPTLTYEEIEVLRQFVKYQLSNI
ncbi:hypothetical protein [Clostridium perfringens]|jgi:hypothetical protein|uniref:Uncharacterized protein n=1 Tax=Clostridium perfringens TaxID=1502 RepID=A0AAP2B0Z4_CLOPF|nr:hypothetical protein [Clostridium perfringens]MBO3356228.1 hypothetical protein [Clostridium perfringens]MBO3359431.1 hypothetical protein [Clostridium perfringens]NGU30994.1 hypothetical protein [Clostridium perfringens]